MRCWARETVSTAPGGGSSSSDRRERPSAQACHRCTPPATVRSPNPVRTFPTGDGVAAHARADLGTLPGRGPEVGKADLRRGFDQVRASTPSRLFAEIDAERRLADNLVH